MFDRIGCNSEEYIKEFGENFVSIYKLIMSEIKKKRF